MDKICLKIIIFRAVVHCDDLNASNLPKYFVTVKKLSASSFDACVPNKSTVRKSLSRLGKSLQAPSSKIGRKPSLSPFSITGRSLLRQSFIVKWYKGENISEKGLYAEKKWIATEGLIIERDSAPSTAKAHCRGNPQIVH